MKVPLDAPPLTERQKAILDFVVEFRARRGVPPTHREICQRFGYRSYGTVHKHLRLLREKGYLVAAWNQKRGLALGPAAREAGGGLVFHLPFLGRIAAGRPIEALPGDEELSVPAHLVDGAASAHYVLRVTGESMIEEGIHDGDLVVVRRAEGAGPGEMVVALVGDEATLKRYFLEGDRVRLQPANPHMEPIVVPAREVRIQGVVVGLMRRF